MEFRPSTLLRVAAPLRSLAQRFMYVSLIVLSFGLMLVGKIDVVLIDHLRAEVTNVAATRQNQKGRNRSIKSILTI